MNKKITDEDIKSIMQDIRDLRDADFHVCPHDVWQANGEPDTTDDITCTCNQFDWVIDKLERFLSTEN